jgi:hypothetical protein
MANFFQWLGKFLTVLFAQKKPVPAQPAVPAMPETFPAQFREDAQWLVSYLRAEAPFISDVALEKIICQFAIETGWGQSELAQKYLNFAGVEWRPYHINIPGATKSDMVTSDGLRSYCQFDSLEAFCKHYILRLDRGPYYAWREKVAEGKIGHLRMWAARPGYVEQIEALHAVHFGILYQELV